MVMEQMQRLDDQAHTMDILIFNKIQNAKQKIANVSTFNNILTPKMTALNQSVTHLGQMLNSLSYKNVLARGYAIVRDKNDKIITNTRGGTPESIEFADGVLKL